MRALRNENFLIFHEGEGDQMPEFVPDRPGLKILYFAEIPLPPIII